VELLALGGYPAVEAVGVGVGDAGGVAVDAGVDVVGLLVGPGVLGAVRRRAGLGLDGVVDHPQEPG